MLSAPTSAAAFLASLTPHERKRLDYQWDFWARPAQLPPAGHWSTWLINAGRGFGKTRSGAEYVRDGIERRGRRRVALVAATAADARDVMVEGESGILAVCPPWNRPKYEPSKRRLTWPNGAIAVTYSADEPNRLRGPQHDDAWCDELASWRYPDAWDMLLFGLRLGADPRCCVTTTPKKTPLFKDVLRDPATAVTTGSTYDNAANLAANFLKRISERYEGTRLGQQELYAHLLEDSERALWKRARIEELRVRHAPDLDRIVVAVDPATSDSETANHTGIIVAGRSADGHGYTLADYSLIGSPAQWAAAVLRAFTDYHADRIVAEVNQGGAMVEHTIRSVEGGAFVPFTAVRATRGKHVRAEPVSALYEQGRFHHVGTFADLEDEQCNWEPGDDSPDRLDALVWAAHDLFPLAGIGGPPVDVEW